MEQFKQNKHKNSTKNTYHKVWTKFNEFVIRLDVIPKTWEERVSLYCGYLICIKNLQSSTVKSYISGIKSVLIDDGYDWKEGKLLLNALTRSCKLKNDEVKTRLPIQKGFLDMILHRISKKFEKQPYLEAMYIAAILISYYGLMRIGEITESEHTVKALNVHTAKNRDQILIILYSSKTHGGGDRPQKIKIHGKTFIEVEDRKRTTNSYKKYTSDCHFCPVWWMHHYTDMRQEIEKEEEQLFVFSDGSNLKPYHIRNLLRQIIRSFNLNEFLYDTHSLRIGRATDLFKYGVHIEDIKQLGRWRSNAVYKYLRDF